MGDERGSEEARQPNPTNQNNRKERFVRWENYRIGQLGTCNQLLLTFTIAALGFAIAQPPKDPSKFANFWAEVCYCLSITFGAVSFSCGILTSVMRLENFRRTAKMTRLKMTEPPKRSESDQSEISKIKHQTGCLDAWTWRLLYSQMAAFAIQTLSLAFALAGKCR